MKYSHETYSLNIPKDWIVETDEDCTSFYSPDESQSLHISDYFKEEGDVSEEDVIAIAETDQLQQTNLPFLNGMSQRTLEGDEVILTWWLYIENHFLLVEFMCLAEQEQALAQQIEDLVYSIKSFHA